MLNEVITINQSRTAKRSRTPFDKPGVLFRDKKNSEIKRVNRKRKHTGYAWTAEIISVSNKKKKKE